MIDFNKVCDFCFEYCENVQIKKSGNGIIARCPFCGDSKKSSKIRRFHLDYYPPYQTYIGRCYNGGCELYTDPTDIIKIVAKLKNISYRQAKKEISETPYNSSYIKKKLKKEKKEVEYEKSTGVLDLDMSDCLFVDSKPNGRIEERLHKHLLSFIEDRCIPVECFVAVKGRYKGRIIIPVYIDNKLVYFQGRSILDEIEPKYLNPYVEKETVIMNIDKFDRSKSIICTEGIIDAYMVNHNQGTTPMGASISDDILGILLKNTDEHVIVALDNPLIDKSGYKNIMKMITKSKYGRSVKYFIMPYPDIKDLNELKVKKRIDDIYQFVLDHSKTPFYITTKFKIS